MGKNILTNLLNDFQGIFVGGSIGMNDFAHWLLFSLAAIDIAIVVLMNIDDADHMKTLIKKVLSYIFFITLVKFWPDILKGVFDGFNWIGFKAGGAKQMVQWISKPHLIATQGPEFAKPIYDHIQTLLPDSIWGVPEAVGKVPEILVFFVIYLLVILSFFIIGIQFFMTTIEFYIVGVIAMLLLPFGALEKTGYLAEKALGGVINFGIKLMTLSFIASASYTILSKYMTKTIDSIEDALYILLGSFAIAFLAIHSPGIVAGILSGSPTLTAGSVAATAIGGAMAARMVGGAVVGGVGAAVKTASAVGSSVSNRIQGAIKTAGAVTEAAKIGADGKSGIGALTGAAKGVGGYAVSKPIGALKNLGQNIGKAIGGNFDAGKADAQKALTGNSQAVSNVGNAIANAGNAVSSAVSGVGKTAATAALANRLANPTPAVATSTKGLKLFDNNTTSGDSSLEYIAPASYGSENGDGHSATTSSSEVTTTSYSSDSTTSTYSNETVSASSIHSSAGEGLSSSNSASPSIDNISESLNNAQGNHLPSQAFGNSLNTNEAKSNSASIASRLKR